MTLLTGITLAIALLGAVLGIINTWVSVDKNRVKLRVVPKIAYRVGIPDPQGRLCIEVMNLSAFPVTVSQVGFLLRGTRDRATIIRPIIHDGGPYPRRLDSRASFTAYSNPNEPEPDLLGQVRCAFAATDCGVVGRGNSPALKKAVREAQNGRIS